VKLYILIAPETSQVSCIEARMDLSIRDYETMSIEQKYGLMKLLGKGTVGVEDFSRAVEAFLED